MSLNKNQKDRMKRERAALKEYYKAGGDKMLSNNGSKKHAKMLSKEANKYEKNAASALGKNMAYKEHADFYDKKYSKAIRKNKVEKAQKFLEKKEFENTKADFYIKEFNKNTELANKTKKLISENSNYMITYKRGSAQGGVGADGGTISIGYDKTKVRMNNEKNQRKYSNKQKARGYDAAKIYYYAY